MATRGIYKAMKEQKPYFNTMRPVNKQAALVTRVGGKGIKVTGEARKHLSGAVVGNDINSLVANPEIRDYLSKNPTTEKPRQPVSQDTKYRSRKYYLLSFPSR